MIGKRWGTSMGRGAAALAAVGLAAALAACGGGSSSSSTASGSATTASVARVPAATSSATTTAVSSKSGGITAPGTKLSVGKTARVPYHKAGASGTAPSSTLAVTVQSFDKGSLSDFNGIQLDATQKASTPYYVKLHVTNLGPSAIDVDGSAAAIEGVDSTGNNQSSVTFIGDFPRCHDAASTTPIPSGKGYDDCLTFLIPGGIKAISYNGTDSYIDSPVTWAP
jgi:hypothetical protein